MKNNCSTYCLTRINPWKVPKGTNPQLWINKILTIYCRTHGLLERGMQIMYEIIYELYDEAGVFAVYDKEYYNEAVNEKSKYVTFKSIYHKLEIKLQELNDATDTDKTSLKDAYTRIIKKLSVFDNKYSIEYQLYGTSEGFGIDELNENTNIILIEPGDTKEGFIKFIYDVVNMEI